jgi:biopolymer transport protein ExbD
MRFRPPRPTSVTLNLAPMVDVMMCLIIFFLLASKLVSAEFQPLRLPFAQAASTKDQPHGARIIMNVQRSSAEPLAADYIVQIWDGERIGQRVLKPEEVEGYLVARAEQIRAQNEEPRCAIRADKEVAYGHVEVVMRACGKARIAKVAFAANAGLDPEDAR